MPSVYEMIDRAWRMLRREVECVLRGKRWMRKFTAVALTVMMLITSVTHADAKGGRTSAENCEPGSPDPDCPDDPPPPPEKGKPSPPAPPPK
jgi:hypothetical protein